MEVEVLNQGRRPGNWRRPGTRRALLALLALAVIYGLLSLGQWWLERPGALERESARIGWSPAADSDALARDIFERVNDERAARSRPTLEWDDQLADMAREWAEEMIATGFRRPPEGFRDRPGAPPAVGEVVAFGQHDTRQLHVGWMREDIPRTYLLLNSFRTTGVGIVCRNDGIMWAVQFFGSSDAGAAIPNRAPPPEPVERNDPGLTCPQ